MQVKKESHRKIIEEGGELQQKKGVAHAEIQKKARGSKHVG